MATVRSLRDNARLVEARGNSLADTLTALAGVVKGVEDSKDRYVLNVNVNYGEDDNGDVQWTALLLVGVDGLVDPL